MNWTLRSATNTGMTTKGSALTHAEVDQNMIEAFEGIKKLNNTSAFSAYSGATVYNPDDLVNYNNYLWKRIGAGTTTGVAPDSDPTKWQQTSPAELVHEKNKDTDMYVPAGGGLPASSIDSRSLWHVAQTKLRYKKVSLSKSQLQNLTTTPIEVVAALGDGKIVVPVAVWCKLNYATTAWSDGTVIAVRHADADVYLWMSDAVLESSISRIIYWTKKDISSGDNGLSQLIVNKKLEVYVQGAPLTIGDASMDLYVEYAEITL